MKLYNKAGKGWAKKILLALFAMILFALCPFVGGRYALNANAAASTPLNTEAETASDTVALTSYSTAPCDVHYYKVEATVNADRTIEFKEEISFTMNITPSSGVFYRSLPKEGDRFLYIKAEGVDNPEFSYRIIDNPEVDGFIDVECQGNVRRGETLTYRFSYTMESRFGTYESDGLIIDFVGGGWPFALSNVDVKINFPAELQRYVVYSSLFGSASNDYVEVLEESIYSLHLHADSLPLTYSGFGSYAAPVTVEFLLAEGSLITEEEQAFSSPTLWLTALIGLAVLAAAVLVKVFFVRKPILSTVVGFTAPENLDPMELGYVLDGTVDNDDITSMIYYFASKGYLNISMESGEVTLIRKRMFSLPDEESDHAKTLFEGLFAQGRTEAQVSDLQNRFYEHADKAKILIGSKRPKMYEKKSVGRFALYSLFAFAAFVLPLLAVGWGYIGGGYFPLEAFIMAVPVAACAIFSWVSENYRYKWKRGKHVGLFIIAAVICAVCALAYFALFSHVLIGVERLLALGCGYAVLFLQKGVLTREEAYMERLGRILGFKEFILVTKKDRIEVMLETNPELFYDVLPYAQVMDVSNEWEEKFKSITIQPPTWYAGDFSYFDYWLISRSMRSMSVAMVSRPQNSSVGRGGGGGFSGGFSGGGGGGGGGGFR